MTIRLPGEVELITHSPPRAYKEFIKKLQREWAIETGIIERLYTWDNALLIHPASGRPFAGS
jgi:hypothetical protein